MDKKELRELKKEDLLKLAKDKNVKGRAKMKKTELIKALLKFFQKPKRKKKSLSRVPSRKKLFRNKLRKESKSPLGVEKEEVEISKFETGKQIPPEVSFKPQESQVAVMEEKIEIPQRYGEDKIALLVRDPWWVYAYWEITPKSWENVRNKIGVHVPLKEVLRVYDITDISEFRGDNANSFFDIELTPFVDNWYINVGNPDRDFCVELGLKTPEGSFYPLIRSNTVRTPRYGMSPITDEEWMISEEEYWKMFGLSGGYGIGKGSLEMQELFKRRFEELISSGFPGSAFSWMQREEIPRRFWLVADAELIVYGATEPDARITIQGRSIKLRKDGTFNLRFALPDGTQEIPIVAKSRDGEEKSIKIVVKRNTERGE